MSSSPPIAILVIGMHRCGTSAVTRTLNLMGAALPANLMAPAADNPTGFWESRDVMAAHNRFLDAVGSRWDDPLPLPRTAFQGDAAARCHDDLLAILHRDLGSAPLFAIKDPRLCRLLPLWRQVLASFGARPMAVLPVRNPLDTAMSLRLRNGMPRAQALALWLIHTLAAERETRDWTRCFVRFETLVADPATTARSVAARLGCFSAEAVAAALPEVARFCDSELMHHHSPQETGTPAMPEWVTQVLGWVETAAQGAEPPPALLDSLEAALDSAAQLYGPLLALPDSSERDELRRKVDNLAAALEQSAQDLTHTETERARLDGRNGALTERIAGLDSRLFQARTEAARLEGQMAALTAERTELLAARQTQAAETARLVERAARAEAALEVKDREAAALSGHLEDARAAQARQTAALEQARRDMAAETARLMERAARAEAALEVKDRETAALSGHLEDARAAHARQTAALEQARRDMAAEREQLAAKAEALGHEVATLVEQLEASRQAARRQAERHARLEQDLETARREQAGLRAALAEREHSIMQRQDNTEAALIRLAAIATGLHGQVSPTRRLGGLLRAALVGRLRRRLGEDRDIATIARSGLFDPAYYLGRYPDVAAAGADPIVHYVRQGAAEGRDPHPAFDTGFYRQAYPDVSAAGINPLAHYACFGATENRRTHAAFGSGPVAPGGLNPLLAARLFPPTRPPQQQPPLPPPQAVEARPEVFPQTAFSWLTPEQRSTLADLFRRYALGGHAGGDWTGAAAAAAELADGFARLPAGAPDISVVIPVHNQVRHTLACLASLAQWPSSRPIEVLIGDDGSSDGTPDLLAAIPHVRVVRSETAEGFVDNCNRTAAHAKGRVVLLLNNDTVVLPGALDALSATFDEYPDCGLAGARLIYPDGRLQEAGGIVWADGSGWNYGRLDDPTLPHYCHVRDADYCSGAAIALPLAVWRSLRGFDTRFRPAYYEDTDLAFRVRAAGLRVLYQPDAAIIHCEGVSNGTCEDAATGLKRFQRINRPKFLDRWRDVLSGHGMPESKPANFAERTRRRRILVLDTTTPTPDRDSGSKDTVLLLSLLRRQGWHVTFLPENLLDDGPHTALLRRMGVECLHRPAVTDLMAAVTGLAPRYDAVLVSRQPLARQVMAPLRRTAPGVKLIFNTIDLHFLREERAAALYQDAAMAERAAETKRHELAAIAQADATLVVSAFEKDLLARVTPAARVWQMPVRRDMPEGPFPPFAERRGVLFVGGFRHPPNQDAARWLLNEIWPAARSMGLDAPLYIAGADAPPFLVDDPAMDVHVLGHVPDLAALFARCRISIAPLRYGAGLKGKVIDSLCHAVPVVATATATEGSGLEHGRHLLTGDSTCELARLLADLHRDPIRWQRLSSEGRDYCAAHFSTQAAGEVLADMLGALGFRKGER